MPFFPVSVKVCVTFSTQNMSFRVTQIYVPHHSHPALTQNTLLSYFLRAELVFFHGQHRALWGLLWEEKGKKLS